MKFEVGKKYTNKDNDDEHFVIQITGKNQRDFEGEKINRYSFKVLKGSTKLSFSHFDDGSIFTERLKPYEDLPRICYILGGEDNPLKIGERFGFYSFYYYVSGEGTVIRLDGEDASIESICEMINCPDKIIRSPQFSDDEEAIMRLCGDNGYWQWYREKGKLYVKEFDEMYGAEMHCITMKGISDEYTREKPFNANTYLESEAKNDG